MACGDLGPQFPLNGGSLGFFLRAAATQIPPGVWKRDTFSHLHNPVIGHAPLPHFA
jgi:hypothetical protein